MISRLNLSQRFFFVFLFLLPRWRIASPHKVPLTEAVWFVFLFRIVKVSYETNNDRFKYNEYIDSYSKKKYIDSYNTKWKKKIIDVHTVNKKKKKKYTDSYNRKEKNDWCAHYKPKKVKKVHRFLQYRRKKWLMCTL